MNGVSSNCGQELLVSVIDAKASQIPDQPYLLYPGQGWETEGYHTMTWKQYRDASNKAAHWLDAELGSNGKGQETIAYVGPNDVRYPIMLPAAIKTGRRLLIPDGRNTATGILNLIESTNCGVWIMPEEHEFKRATKQPDKEGLRHLKIPPVGFFLDAGGMPSYPYNRTYESAKDDIVLIIHTSGTTGVPKPIFITNGFLSVVGGYPVLNTRYQPRGITYNDFFSARVLSPCPPQWLASIYTHILFPVFFGAVTTIIPPDMTPPIDIPKFAKIINENAVEGIFTPPHLIEELYRDPLGVEVLKKLDFVTYGGALLDRAVGNAVAELTRLRPLVGSTETGLQPSLHPVGKGQWNTFDFVPETGARFEKISDSVPNSSNGSASDELYELQLDVAPCAEHHHRFQSAFHNPQFRDMQTIRLKELYIPREDDDGTLRWQFRARSDDLTKLSWLAKFHAGHIETTVSKDLRVKGVVIGGEGRDVPYVIIELYDNEHRDDLLANIYDSIIGKVNEEDLDEIRIPPETVMLADSARAFPRSGKMVVARQEVEKLYERDIEEMYAKFAARRREENES